LNTVTATSFDVVLFVQSSWLIQIDSDMSCGSLNIKLVRNGVDLLGSESIVTQK